MTQAPGQENTPSLVTALWGQLAGLAGALGLLWLNTNGRLAQLGPFGDLSVWLVLAVWFLSLVCLIGWVRRQANRAPWSVLLLSLAPALAALGFSCLAIGRVPQTEDPSGSCNFWLTASFWGERLRAVGLVGSGTMLLGCLSMFMPKERRILGRHFWQAFCLMLALWLLTVVWVFTDPTLPTRAVLGDWTVRGLWILAVAPFVLWVWAHVWPVFKGVNPSLMVFPSAVASSLGLLLTGLGIWSLYRAIGLNDATTIIVPSGSDPLAMSLNRDAGLVASISALKMIPLLILLLAGAWILAWLRTARGQRRALAILLLLVAGTAVVWIGFESGWRQGFGARCQPPPLDTLELPEGQTGAPIGPGVLVTVEGQKPPDAAQPAAQVPIDWKTMEPTANLLVAADTSASFGGLMSLLQAACRSSRCRSSLLVHPKDGQDDPCLADARLFGACLSHRVSMVQSIPLEVAHLSSRSSPPPGVVANILVEREGIEVTFGGFGAGISAETLNSLAINLPNRMGVRDLGNLGQALWRAKTTFPQSQSLILLAHEELAVGELAAILDIVRSHYDQDQKTNTPLFPVVTIGPSTR